MTDALLFVLGIIMVVGGLYLRFNLGSPLRNDIPEGDSRFYAYTGIILVMTAAVPFTMATSPY